ncbi:MAG: dihydrofolate reductase family protein [Streptosporangiaceae bacterium]
MTRRARSPGKSRCAHDFFAGFHRWLPALAEAGSDLVVEHVIEFRAWREDLARLAAVWNGEGNRPGSKDRLLAGTGREMMRKIVAGLAISLDGVVEAPSQGNWMRFNDEMAEIIAAGIAEADAILLGRRTYLEFAEMWPSLGSDVPMADFMNNTPKYVVSRTLRTLGWAHSTLLAGDLAEEVRSLKEQPGRSIQMPGSPTLVRSLLRCGLLDELALMIHPVVLGSGMRLFDETTGRIGLELMDARTLSTGVVSLTYARMTA